MTFFCENICYRFFFSYYGFMKKFSDIALTIAQHPKWMQMPWDVRGMALQLMAMADEDQLDTLAPEDDFWRNCLGFPSRRIMEDALKQSVRARGNKGVHELDLVWADVWKPQLLNWFILIDDDFLKTKPSFSDAKGRYWYPLLGEGETEKDILDNKHLDRKKKTNTKRGAREKNSELQNTATPAKKTKKTAAQAVDPNWDYPLIRYSPNILKKCWDVPIAQSDRLMIWKEAVTLLSDGSEKQEQGARQFIGKLIKDFGESQVAAAVAVLIVRIPRPADPKSFLRKQLKNATEGSEATQKARSQRSKVPL